LKRLAVSKHLVDHHPFLISLGAVGNQRGDVGHGIQEEVRASVVGEERMLEFADEDLSPYHNRLLIEVEQELAFLQYCATVSDVDIRCTQNHHEHSLYLF
jgi:hypothetical protein